MGKARLEAFSDGVIAVIITIMVLEMKVPHGTDIEALVPLVPVFFAYVLSFVMAAIYWNNHHHMMHAVQHVNGTTGSSASRSVPWGTFISRTMIVMMTAITPSLNASSRAFPMARILS